MVKKQAKRIRLLISKETNGEILIHLGNHYVQTIQARGLTPEEKYRAVHAAILRMGMVYSEKIEKYVRKELNYPK